VLLHPADIFEFDQSFGHAKGGRLGRARSEAVLEEIFHRDNVRTKGARGKREKTETALTAKSGRINNLVA
jgi:hypothetical protein